MKLSFQLLDCDYIMLNNTPVIRLFGKTKEGNTVCAFHDKYLPYFFIIPKENKKNDVLNFLKERYDKLLVGVEEVEKYLPIGFQKTKSKLLKVVLNDPSQLPAIRDDLKTHEFIKDIFEADILFKYRFMADYNLSGMKTIEVDGNTVDTNTVKTKKQISVNSIEASDEDINADLKYMSIDIETVSENEGLPNPKKDKIIIISLSFSPKHENKDSLVLISKTIKTREKNTITFKDEKDMLKGFIKIIDSYDPDIITGYNCNNFDIPYIAARLKECKISATIGRCQHKQIISKKLGTYYKNIIVGRIIIDVYELIKESVGKGLLRLKRHGLGDVSKELLKEDKIDIAHSEIERYWNGNEDQFGKLIEYARKDAQLALKLLLEKNMLDKFIEISKVSGLLLQDILDGGEATRIENLLLREFNKLDYVIPCKPSSNEILKRIAERETKGLKGALVLEPQVGLHTNCIVYLDFHAMYPSIFIAYNICPTTLMLSKENIETTRTPNNIEFASAKTKQGIIPRIVKNLIEDRNRVKNQMKQARTESERRELNAKQYALKIMANAFYGYTGYVRARLYLLDIANAITSCGRFLIQKTNNIVESDKKFTVIYGDTDSIMVKIPTSNIEEAFEKGERIEQKINTTLKNIVQIKIESVFKTLLILTKKRYAGLSYEKTNGEWKEKIIMKGIETVRRDWCDLTSNTLHDVLQIILKEQDPKKAFNYVKDILNKLESNQIPIESLVITKSISKSLREYKGTQPHIELLKKLRKRSPATAPGVGDRIGFVIVKGLQLMSERAEDPEYVKQHGLKIDSKYYIENQILPPLERVFEAIGINKSELVGFGKQLLLKDAIKNGIKKPQFLATVDGFICNRCNKTFRRVPLIGKCLNCNGEILFYSGEMKSRYFNLNI